ncbi:hypothetical protein E2P81_ATG07509 [Venturia nashicola]|uniref:Uncharacterized protein n=1 Tax=Venturia nashicola TaxID=86259 RepID=A0A4Z1NVT9_9PEZI|nr:hypothetical protein E6O75_ATG07667 [Venturia nashicola]TLD32019.1 hypothetical protein E2P81_ATG07509 [Venturia nashicola]
MPSYTYNNLPPPASTYQAPSKQQHYPTTFRYQNQTYQHQSSFQNQQSTIYEKPLPPTPITYNLTPQHKLFSSHILALYYHDSHEKYYRWSEDDIAVDLAYRSLIDGISMDVESDVETNAVELWVDSTGGHEPGQDA